MSELQRRATDRLASRGPSRSRTASRSASRDVDDDDTMSVFSDNDWSVAAEPDDKPAAGDWRAALKTNLAALSTDRKRTNTEAREAALAALADVFAHRYSLSTVRANMASLRQAVSRSLASPRSTKEASLVCRLLAVLAITDPAEDSFSSPTVVTQLKSIVRSDRAKVPAIYALATAIFFVEDPAETDETIDFLLEIVESNGTAADAADDAATVAAAIAAVGFLGTGLDSVEDLGQRSLPALVDQLDAADVDVRVAAGQAIACLYQRYADEVPEPDDDDEPASSVMDARFDGTPGSPAARPPAARRSDAEELYYDTEALVDQLRALATSSSKSLAKASRRTLHAVFRDVLDTVRASVRRTHPDVLAGDDAPAAATYSIYVTLNFGKFDKLNVNSWATDVRLQHLRRILGHGIGAHFSRNEAVRSALDPDGFSRYSRAAAAADDSGDDSADDPVVVDPAEEKAYAKAVNLHAQKARQSELRKARQNTARLVADRDYEAADEN
ncbi:interferon-related developmental regulator-domain-containing protein [Dipodascopsis tothii]|uniref:interferon-related developmental regulator-domain-containing protein n=1 Tax=Dipodascopsis tothii TaxID=44089 RepID=UPI0034CE0616